MTTTIKSDFGYFPEYSNLELGSLRDVDLRGLADGNVLVWNEAEELWDVGAVAGANELNDLTDVNIAGPALNEVLAYDGSEWTNQAQGAIPLGNLSDVTLTAPSSSQFLQYNGTIWVNANLPTYTFSELTDTNINTATTNDILSWDGSDWVNQDTATLTTITASGTITGGTVTDGTATITGGTITTTGSIVGADLTVVGTAAANAFNAPTLSDGTITINSGNITGVDSFTADHVFINKGNVTQLTSATTPVTVNASAGIITTVSQTLAASATARFQVNNSEVDANSAVFATVVGYASGSTGIPHVYVDDVQANQFDIVVANVHASSALNALVEISFVVH